MTPKDFAAALTNRLRRQGVDFRPIDVEAFAAKAWTQGGPPPDLDAWAGRFLAAQAHGAFTRSLAAKPRRFGLRAAGKFLMLGAAASLTSGVVLWLVIALLLIVPGLNLGTVEAPGPFAMFFLHTSFSLLLILAPCVLVLGVILTSAARLDRVEPGFDRTVLGVILAVICGAFVATVAFALSIYLVLLRHPEHPESGWAMMGVVFMWLPGAGGGAILGGILEAMKVRHSWLIGGCLGGLIVGGYPCWLGQFLDFLTRR